METDQKAVERREIHSDLLNKILDLLRMGPNPKDALRQRIRLWWIMGNSHVCDAVLCLWMIVCVND